VAPSGAAFLVLLTLLTLLTFKVMKTIKKIFKWTIIVLTMVFLTGVYWTRQPVIDSMSNRFINGNPTIVDHVHLRSLYAAMIGYGYFAFPEASIGLYKIMLMGQKDADVSSEFFYNHPDVKEALRRGKYKIMYGASSKWKKAHPEYYYPKEIEYRLFYAFNPLYLNPKTSTAYFAPYQASTDWNVETPLKMGWLIDFRLKDALMHKVAPNQGGTVYFKYNPQFNKSELASN